MGVAIEREEDRLARRLVVVASVAATAPIAGLLGTVCGVMATLSAIAAMPSPTLAAVAPGVAAALLPAAVGLVVGVPAVVAAKKNEADVARFMRRLKGFAAEFGAILSRQGEEQAGHTPRSR
jgi:biopolymer transport protein TolQ